MVETSTENIGNMNKCLCAFLILNYETYWETFNCVKSIFETIGENSVEEGTCQIVIIDNGSKNDSLQKIRAEYKDVSGIHIIENKINMGFAKGNNSGFLYAKESIRPNFMCLINSDIVMTDKNFINKLVNGYAKNKFDVAGPNVALPNGTCLNPMRSTLIDVKSANEAIHNLTFRLRLCNLHIELFYAIFLRIKAKLGNNQNTPNNSGYSRQLDLNLGEQIHGCFIIFAKSYIDRFDGLYNKTFLYGEEALLRMRCLRTNMSMWYLSDLFALHNESQTEKFIGGNIAERHRRRHKNMLNSIKIIRNYLEDERSI